MTTTINRFQTHTPDDDTIKRVVRRPQHTPGPWHAIEWNCHAPTAVATIVDGRPIIVAECCGHGRDSKESVGDARLIAAAPDLLAALRAALAVIPYGNESVELMARSAILKAGGA